MLSEFKTRKNSIFIKKINWCRFSRVERKIVELIFCKFIDYNQDKNNKTLQKRAWFYCPGNVITTNGILRFVKYFRVHVLKNRNKNTKDKYGNLASRHVPMRILNKKRDRCYGLSWLHKYSENHAKDRLWNFSRQIHPNAP